MPSRSGGKELRSWLRLGHRVIRGLKTPGIRHDQTSSVCFLRFFLFGFCLETKSKKWRFSMPNQQTHGDQMDELLSFDDSFGGFTTHFLSASTCAVPQSLSG